LAGLEARRYIKGMTGTLLNATAQIIFASCAGVAILLRALAVFLPVWRDKDRK
jgi:hypothetical protein